jgi:hypothetical protein
MSLARRFADLYRGIVQTDGDADDVGSCYGFAQHVQSRRTASLDGQYLRPTHSYVSTQTEHINRAAVECESS